MLNKKDFVEELLKLEDKTEIARLIEDNLSSLNKEVIDLIAYQMEENISSDPALALKMAETSFLVSQALKDPLLVSLSKRSKAQVLCVVGSHRESLRLYDELIEFFSSLGEDLEVAKTNIGKVEVLRIMGRYQDALRLSQETFRILERYKAEYELAKLNRITASIFFWQNKFAKSLQLLEKAEGYFSVRGKELELAQTRMNKSIVLPHLNRFREALRKNREARRFFQTKKMNRQIANADYSAGNIYYYMGQYVRALDYYKRAKDVYQGLGMERAQANVDTCIANTYLRLGLYEETIESYHFAQKVFEDKGMRYNLALTWYDQAVAYGNMGKLSKSEELFDRAKKVFEEESLKTKVAGIDLERSKIFITKGEYAKALELSLEALNLMSEVSGAGLLSATAKLVAARAYLKMRKLEEAKGFYDSLKKEYKIPWVSHQAYYGLGKISLRKGDKEGAYRQYQRSIEEIEKMQTSLKGRENLTISFLRDKLEVFQDMVYLCLEMGRKEEALSYVERAKSRALVDLLSHKLDFKGNDKRFLEKVRKLKEELNWWYSKVEREEGEEGKRGKGLKVFQAIKTRERRLLQIIRAQELSNPRGREPLWPVRTDGISSREIRGFLNKGTMLLEYYIANNQIHLFSLTRDDLVVYQDLTSLQKVSSLLQKFRFQLSKLIYGPKPGKNRLNWIDSATKDHLRSLYRLLIEPISDLGEYPHLLIIPHSLLHLLPFGALYNGQNFLIEKHLVSYSPSARIFKLCSEREAKANGGLLAMGIPDKKTPHMGGEVEAIKSIFPDALAFTGKVATKRTLERYAAGSNILHIASHGVFREDSPLFSRLKLADGWLTVADVYDLKLNASLVTLSGCDTGLNTLAIGDEILGMTRGFLYAGASSLLVSLWAVSDTSTLALMETFYRGLCKGKSKAQAIRDAQVGMLRKRKYWSHPYYWAPFILIGRDENVQIK